METITKNLVQEHVMTDLNGIGLYVGTYEKYSKGSLFGEWLDMSTFDDAEDFFACCHELHADEESPELMYQDYQGFPESWYSECMGEQRINQIIEYAKLDDSDREMLDDYAEIFNGYDIDDARDRSLGNYDTEEDYCEEYANECHNIPESLKFYIDYSAMARDFFMCDLYHGSNGYVFTRC